MSEDRELEMQMQEDGTEREHMFTSRDRDYGGRPKWLHEMQFYGWLCTL